MDQQRVAELHDPHSKKGGTGYLIRNNLILTSHHVIAELGEPGIIGRRYHVRFIGDYEQGRTKWITEGCYLCWDDPDPKHDLALLKLERDKPEFLSSQELTICFGQLGGKTLLAEGIGFPAVQQIGSRQNPEPLDGRLSRIAGLKEGQLRLQVTSPIPNDPSQWQGISGTALFVKDLLVGVIVETNKSFAEKVLWATPISLVANNKEFCKLLLDDSNGKIILQDLEPIKLNLFQAPPLPTYYVDRPEYSQELKTRLLTESNDARTLVVTAIHGMGSVGKSTLATALAHDPKVQDHFRDGVLWVTLGQQPNLLPLLSSWVQALGDYNFKALSEEAASIQLRTLLYDKAVLLVVDDAWNTGDAQAFNVGGARCQVLVTTRDSTIADALGANTCSLDVMTPSQAMKLLTNKLRHDITGAERQQAEILAKELGYLPLALELAAAQVESRVSWAVLLQDIQGEIVRLKTFDRPGARDVTDETSLKKLSLTASLNLSVQRLTPVTRENFIWLGILPEDVTITQQMTATLWDMDNERDAADELRYLHSKALLLSGVPFSDGTPTYRLHDLFHDLARNLLTAPPKPKRQGDLPGLGITLPQAHTKFLEKYQNKTSKNLWHTLSNDGYIHQHLVWHLEKAEQIEEIHSLLREESATRGNGWYEACASLGQTANFATDVARAWKLADDSWTLATLPQVIGLQCRYALIIASLNSLSANLPVELLIALVQKNVWTPEQGLAYVLQSSNPKEKANLLTELADHLPPNLKELGLLKALAAAREIRSEEDRADALSSLADKLPELLPEALAAAREIKSEDYRESALKSLVDKLSPKLLPEALAAAREIKSEYYRESALKSLVDKLSPKLLPEALAVAREIENDENRAKALRSLADKFPELLPEALVAAREIKFEWHRASVLISLADKLPPKLLPEALAAAREIENEWHRADALSSLVDKLPPKLLPEALAAAREIQSEYYRARVLISLADKLPELLPEALAAAREIQSEYYRADALSSLADKLPELLPEALAAAREIENDENRADALSSLADKLPELLPEALAAAREIKFDENRAKALSSLADKLPPKLLPEVLAAVREILSEKARAKALKSLADKLPAELLPEALAAALEIQSEKYRGDALNSLADKLPPELLPKVLAAALEIQSRDYRVEALNSLADKLPPELLPEALAAALEIQSEEYRAKALSSLADKLPPELLPEALAAALEIQSEKYRGDALRSLANKLPLELLPEILADARKSQSRDYRARVLISLADKLPPELLPKALAAARAIHDTYYRAKALRSLADKLPELLPEALAAAREIESVQSKEYRAEALSSLTDKFPKLLSEALTAAFEIENEYYRDKALSSLAEKLPLRLLPGALVVAWQMEDVGYRADTLICLAYNKLRVDPLSKVLTLALARLFEKLGELLCKSLYEECRTYALNSFLYKLQPDLLPKALAAARQIPHYEYRAEALSSLADKLPELLPKALNAATAISLEENRIKALRSLADKFPELLPEILADARKSQSRDYCAKVLISLANKLPPELLPEALADAREVQSEEYRAKALSSLADKYPELLPEALAATREIQSEEYRAEALSSLVDKLLQLQKDPLFCLWRDTLHILSVRTRPNLLTDISALTPVIFTLGDKLAVKDTASAIQDVSRWWG